MDPFDQPTEEIGAPPGTLLRRDPRAAWVDAPPRAAGRRGGPVDGPGLSRRQLLGRVGGGLAGVTLASLGLDLGRRAVAAPGPVSVRDLLRRISAKGCDPSRGIRVALPNDHPFISLRAVARRYAGNVVNFCQPVQFSVRNEALAGGGRVVISGSNFTPGGLADIRFVNLQGRVDLGFSVPVQPDGTFSTLRDLRCDSPGNKAWTVEVTDAATGRKPAGPAPTASFTCAQPPPPPSGGGTTRPSISVSQQGAVFTVKGTGFLPNHAVYIRLTDNAALASYFFQTTSDGSGAINYGINAPCNPGFAVSFSANDGRRDAQDLTGTLWSNTVTLTCV